MSLKFEVLILGNSSASPMYDRHPTAQVLNFNAQFFLIDCGEGTQVQLYRYGVKSHKIGHIFISHLHGDHYLGLVGLLSSMNLHGRKTDLHLYGPAPLKEIIDLQLYHSDTRLQYNLLFHPTSTDAPAVILETRTLKVTSFPLKHRVPTTGFRFDEVRTSAVLILDKAQEMGVPVVFYNALKAGVDCEGVDGTIFRAAEFTTAGPPPRSYAFCSDTRAFESYLSAIHDVDLLYHETTFDHGFLDRAIETFHSTSLEAAQVAKCVGAKKLLMGHYSARYKDLSILLEEAKSEFVNSELSFEGNWYKI